MGQLRNATESNLLYFASEVERMGEALDLSDAVVKSAVQLYIQAIEHDYRPSTIDRATATCLYLAAQVRSLPVTIDDVAGVSRRESKNIYHESNKISDLIGLPIEPADPTRFVEEYANELGWEGAEIDRAKELCESVKSEGLHSGKAPSGVAASVLYARSEIEDLGYSQKEISDVAGVVTVTIRNNYPEFMLIAPETSPRDLAFRDFDMAFQVIESTVDLPAELCEQARRRAREIAESEVPDGSSQGGIAAAAYVRTAGEHGIDLDASQLADAVGVGAQTVEKYEELI